MSNVYRFIYDSSYDEDGEGSVFPQASSIKTRHYFCEGTTWQPILWQFCKFLESTGYVGVTEKVIIIDDYGLYDGTLFETIRSEDLNKSYDNGNPDEFALDNEDKDAC